MKRRVLIMGAAGRDFHNFRVVYRDDPSVEVVAFTATQIPGIDSRTYPADLAGPLYPAGIPIVPESELTTLIREKSVSQVVFAYSDVAHVDVMHKASTVLAAGADFILLGPDRTMIQSNKPVTSICAVRTGVGKSGISRKVWEILAEHGLKGVDIRHPMPYRDLTAMRMERYASLEDLDVLGATIEEREEYEHLIEVGAVVMAGVDYADILEAAEKEADVIIWDGGNNDMPFIKPDLEIVALDPHRPGHERLYHPGETNFLRADVLVINKVDTADPVAVAGLREAAETFNPRATVVECSSIISVAGGEAALAGAKRGLSVTELARAVRHPPATVHRLLGVLKRRGFVRQDEDTARYSLTLKMLDLSFRLLGRSELRLHAYPVLREYVLRTGEDPDNPGHVLQVMPWPVYGKMTEGDLRAVYEYLRAIPPIRANTCGVPSEHS